MPSLLILIPLCGLIILNMPFFRNTMKRLVFWFAVALFIIQILLAINHHPIFWTSELNQLDAFFKVNMKIGHFGFIMLLCIGIVSLASLFVAYNTVPDENERFKFINLLIAASIGMSGVVIAKDVFSMYLFLEITAISSFVLISFEKDRLALEGAFKYMVQSAIASVMLLTSMALILLASNDMSFASIHNAVHSALTSKMAIFAVGLFICGLLIKGGVVPFHGWLPGAYTAAPPAVSVLLAGIVTKTAGIYTLMRVITSVFGFSGAIKGILLALGAISIVFGALAAITQKDFKKMLAYSSISQIGYIVLGFATATPLGFAGAVFHIFNHSIFKSLLFVNSAAVSSRMGTSNMDRMGGLASKMPYTGVTSVIGFLSAAGIPPLAGFWSKLMIVLALWAAGYHAYSIIAIVAGALTLGYLLIMQKKVFFGLPGEAAVDIKEARNGFVAAAVLLAAVTVGAGLFFPVVFYTFAAPIKQIFFK